VISYSLVQFQPSSSTILTIKISGPAAGLRIVCREQEDSMKWPFDKAAFEAIQDALDLLKIYSYFNLPKSDACGKYLGIPGQC
jgi:hypothetical protein